MQSRISVQQVRDTYIKVLSTLALIEWPSLSTEFFNLFLKQGRTDEKLPFPEEDLDFLDSFQADGGKTPKGTRDVPLSPLKSFRAEFFNKQELFVTVPLKDDHRAPQIVRVRESARWPFLTVPRKVSEGAYGKVFSVRVAAKSIKTIPKQGSPQYLKVSPNIKIFAPDFVTLNVLRKNFWPINL